jgi:hypothetical protein
VNDQTRNHFARHRLFDGGTLIRSRKIQFTSWQAASCLDSNSHIRFYEMFSATPDPLNLWGEMDAW